MGRTWSSLEPGGEIDILLQYTVTGNLTNFRLSPLFLHAASHWQSSTFSDRGHSFSLDKRRVSYTVEATVLLDKELTEFAYGGKSIRLDKGQR